MDPDYIGMDGHDHEVFARRQPSRNRNRDAVTEVRRKLEGDLNVKRAAARDMLESITRTEQRLAFLDKISTDLHAALEDDSEGMMLKIEFVHSAGRGYTYLALCVRGLWWVTGKNMNGVTLDRLITWLTSHGNIEQVSVLKADKQLL